VKKARCTDDILGGKIGLEVVFQMAQGKEPHLSPEQLQHLEQCEKCRDLMPLWMKKGKAAHEHEEGRKVVEAAERGDPSILRKELSEGLGFFKPAADVEKPGILVIVDPADHYTMYWIRTNVTTQEFQSF
jgi:hypothetical protein